MRRRAAAQSLTGRDIGELPEVQDRERRESCATDLRRFCEVYFPEAFSIAWSPDHLEVLAKIETVVLAGGQYAIAMPRGSGKTTICEVATVWSVIYGHHVYAILIGADRTAAVQNLDSIRTELEHNDRLLDDFPEVVYPIRRLEGITQRAVGQRYDGKPTLVKVTDSTIVLPTIDGSPCAGSIIGVASLTAGLRGRKHKRADGSNVRPSLVLIDDPQTDESAMSPSQCAGRLRTINGAVLGLAGPGQKIAALAPVTVVRRDDLADRLLDRDKNPVWNGQRMKLVYEFPDDEKIWAEYAHIRDDCYRNDEPLDRCNAFYAKNREAMDKGARVAWPDRKKADELSAIQHAMNLLYDRGDRAFWAEYQNEPMPESTSIDDELLRADQICKKTSGYARGLVPATCTKLAAMIDVQGQILFWSLLGFEDDFTSYVIDYGTHPDQGVDRFTLRDLKHTLSDNVDNAGLEARIYAGLDELVGRLASTDYRTDDGAALRVSRILVDANWGQSTEVVYKYARESNHAGVVTPSHGRYIGASSKPIAESQRKRGDRVGLNWKIPADTSGRPVRHVTYDTNYWKSFLHARLATPTGDPGALTLFGTDKDHRRHELFAEHLTAEYRIKTSGRGREVDEWKLRADGLDNHWLDCCVGACVAASIESVKLFGTEAKAEQKRAPIKLSELRRS